MKKILTNISIIAFLSSLSANAIEDQIKGTSTAEKVEVAQLTTQKASSLSEYIKFSADKRKLERKLELNEINNRQLLVTIENKNIKNKEIRDDLEHIKELGKIKLVIATQKAQVKKLFELEKKLNLLKSQLDKKQVRLNEKERLLNTREKGVIKLNQTNVSYSPSVNKSNTTPSLKERKPVNSDNKFLFSNGTIASIKIEGFRHSVGAGDVVQGYTVRSVTLKNVVLVKNNKMVVIN